MSSRDCPDSATIDALLGLSPGSLADDERGRLWGHLAQCEACKQQYGPRLPFTGQRVEELASDRVGLPEIPGYDIGPRLGQGTFAVVHEGFQRSLKRVSAVKVFRPGTAASDRFRLEMEVLARLNHPHIVQVYEGGESQGWLWLAMEKMDGDLDQLWEGKSQSPRGVAEVVCQLSEAVFHAHQRGVLHRDLKPANVLVADGGVPKVTDFGLAKVFGGEMIRLSGSGEMIGTPVYMAPEQIKNEDPDARADVYGLGAILYEGLTGKPPFDSGSMMDVLQQVANDLPVAPTALCPEVPRDLEVICLKCLLKERERRYQSAAELREDLERYLDGEPIRARTPTLSERAWFWARRNRTLAAVASLALALLAGLVVALGWGLWQARQATRAAVGLAAAESEAKGAAEDLLTAERKAADAARNEAQAQRQLVEVERTARLVDLRRQAASLARVGGWREAQPVYRQLQKEEQEPEHRQQAALGALRAAIFLDDLAAAEKEVANFPGPVVARLAGAWKFERAMLHLDQSMRKLKDSFDVTGEATPDETRAVALLREVVGDEAVNFADRETARAVLAGSAAEAMKHYDAALLREPGHPYASVYAVSAEMMGGRLEEALARVEVWRRLNPRSPETMVLRAALFELLGRSGEARGTLAAFDPGGSHAGVLSDGAVRGVRDMLTIFRMLNEYLRDGVPEEVLYRAAFFARLVPVIRSLGGAEGLIILRVPMAPAQRQAMTHFMRGAAAAMETQHVFQMLGINLKPLTRQEAVAALDRSAPFAPAGVRSFASGVLTALLFGEARQKGAKEEMEALRGRIVRHLDDAAAAPTLFDVRRVCLISAAGASLMDLPAEARPAALAGARARLRQAITSAPMTRPFARRVLPFARQAEDEALVNDLNRYLGGK